MRTRWLPFPKPNYKDDRGAVLVFFAIVLPVVLGFTALVVDLGYGFYQKRQVQNAADAAALAAAQDLAVGNYGSATNTAVTYATANRAQTVQVEYLPSGPSANTISVVVTAGVNWSTFFARVFGVNNLNADASATVKLDGVSRMNGPGIYPIATHESTVWDAINSGQPVDIWNGEAPGNFGWLRWAGESPNVPSLIAALTPPGTAPPISVGDWIDGRPGVKNASGVRDALDWWVSTGTPMTVLVWDQVTGSGSNAKYHVVGFAAFVLESYSLPGQNRITARFLRWENPQGIGGGPDYGLRVLRMVN